MAGDQALGGKGAAGGRSRGQEAVSGHGGLDGQGGRRCSSREVGQVNHGLGRGAQVEILLSASARPLPAALPSPTTPGPFVGGDDSAESDKDKEVHKLH